MESFIKKYTTIPRNFIEDFFDIVKESYADTDIIIDFDIVCKWLEIKKSHLKETLVGKFEKDFDYMETKLTKKSKKTASNNYIEVKITPQCFKELCMISQTPKAKEVRKYFLELEKIIKKYQETIQEQMLKQIGLLKNNQKPKVDIKGGVIYVIEALNTDLTLYKIGKSIDTKNRFNTYNSGNANDIEPIFIIKVNDLHKVEYCIKNIIKEKQYRKYKEVYEIDLDTLKEIMSSCKEFYDGIKDIFEKDKKKVKANIKRMKEDKKLFIYIQKYD